MSPRDAATYTPSQAIVDQGISIYRPNQYQCDMVLAALVDLDKAMSNPVYGHLVWDVISRCTPESIKATIDRCRRGEDSPL